MLPDSAATDQDKAIIAGHYVFSTPESRDIKARVAVELEKSGIELNHYLKDRVKESITRYMRGFRLVSTE
jgi:hypothetical protein